MTAILVIVSLVLTYGAASAPVEMKIYTAKGFVAFSVNDDWPVLSMQSQMPIAAAAFQIPNAADQGTPHSTNLVLSVYQRDSEKGCAAFEAAIKPYGASKPKVESLKEWTIFRQEAKQGDTVYSIWDAKRAGVGDASVSVRLAWPHLEANSKTYDAEMESTFRSFLGSVYGRLGPYVPHDGEVIRHPEQ